MNPYEILGLDKHCSKRDVDKALKKLAKIHHPDKGGNAETFNQIMIAVQILRDPYRRKLYDEHGLCFDVSESIMQQEVIGKLKEIIREWIQHELQTGRQYPIHNFLFRKINEQFDAIRQRNEQLNGFIKTLTARKSKISVVEGQVNYVHTVIEEQIEMIKTDLINLEKSRYMVNCIKDIAEKYSSEDIQTMSSQPTGTTTYFRW